MARRSRARSRSHSDKWIGLFLVIVGVALTAALVTGVRWVRQSKPPLDKQTNCPRGGPTAVHVIIFDRSDPISGQQAQRIRQIMEQYKKSATLGYRFDIYTFEGDNSHALYPTLRVCSPGAPEDANEFFENPKFVRRRFEQKFSSVLDGTLDHLLKESTRPNSPILESLRAAAITSFGGSDKDTLTRRVTLFSDMIQHTTNLSHFRSTPTFSKLMRNPSWPTLQPNLKKAKVEIYYLLRPDAKRRDGKTIQSRGHQLFWDQVIQAGNGLISKIEPM